MKLFMAMPFADEFNDVYAAVKGASSQLGLTSIRVDELYEPGSIIQQIFREISESDFVVAEVSSKNPNVYYEVGLAHCVRKPTLLLAEKGAMNAIPFDIRHNRVLVYEKNDTFQLKENLVRHFTYFIHHLGPNGSPPPLEKYLDDSCYAKPKPLINLTDEQVNAGHLHGLPDLFVRTSLGDGTGPLA